MRSRPLLILFSASIVAFTLPGFSRPAAAQSTPQTIAADDPGLPPVLPASQRNQYVKLSTGAGAILGVIVVDIVTGGMLLSPLGLPSAAALLTAEAVAAAPPTYSIAQRLFAGVATVAAVVGGGYFGSYLVRPSPDFIRLEE